MPRAPWPRAGRARRSRRPEAARTSVAPKMRESPRVRGMRREPADSHAAPGRGATCRRESSTRSSLLALARERSSRCAPQERKRLARSATDAVGKLSKSTGSRHACGLGSNLVGRRNMTKPHGRCADDLHCERAARSLTGHGTHVTRQRVETAMRAPSARAPSSEPWRTRGVTSYLAFS